MPRGRFAPSPTGQLHVGNLRTALAAWFSAASSAGDFIVRFEDLDRVTSRRDWAESQLADLSTLGITSSVQPVFQSERFALYDAAIDSLRRAGSVYECFCTRKDIAEAAAAPHGIATRYPGTCRQLTDHERRERARSRKPALRLRSGAVEVEFVDEIWGPVSGVADDVVVRRNDGVPAYNIAVVVDDAEQGVTEVVRGDDLRDVTASQVLLQKLLGLGAQRYAHVPLVVGTDGERLAKRHGAVTLSELTARGWTPDDVYASLCASLSCSGPGDFSWANVPRERWMFSTEIRGNIVG